jgi:hypothetical protein
MDSITLLWICLPLDIALIVWQITEFRRPQTEEEDFEKRTLQELRMNSILARIIGCIAMGAVIVYFIFDRS